MPSETRSFASEDAAAWASRCAKNAAALSTAMLASSATISTPVGTSSSTVPRSQSPGTFGEGSLRSAITGRAGSLSTGCPSAQTVSEGIHDLAGASTDREGRPAAAQQSDTRDFLRRFERHPIAAMQPGCTDWRNGGLSVEPVAGHRLRTCGDRRVHGMCGARSGVLDEGPRGLPGTSDYGDLRIQCRPGLGEHQGAPDEDEHHKRQHFCPHDA